MKRLNGLGQVLHVSRAPTRDVEIKTIQASQASFFPLFLCWIASGELVPTRESPNFFKAQ